MADDDKSVDSDEEVEMKEEKAEPEVVEDATLTNPDVVTKYQEAAKIAQAVLVDLIPRVVAGAKITELCKIADALIEEKAAAIFKGKGKNGKAIMRGVAFPVCLSVNEYVCHVSPFESETTYPDLAVNDLVKIDMAVHVDGFIAAVAHTVTVAGGEPLTAEKQAQRDNTISAAYTAAEAAVRTLKPGNTNVQVTAAIKKVAEAFGVHPISGTVMHQMKQFVIDGNKMILLRDEVESKIDACTFEAGEVYAIDIAMSSGEGKPRESGNRTTVFKRAVEKKYSLKSKTSRSFFNEVNKRFPTLPFTIRSFPDEVSARMGVRECVMHELLAAYPVLVDRKEDVIAHVKVTVLLLPSGNTAQITGLAPYTFATTEPTKLSASMPIGLQLATALAARGGVMPEDVMELLSQQPVESKKKAKKAAAKKAAAATAEATTA